PPWRSWRNSSARTSASRPTTSTRRNSSTWCCSEPVSSPLRRRIRHVRRFFGYGSLVALILLALLVSVFNQLLPAVESHPDKIAKWLSERVGEPVSFSHARGEWTRRGPRFVLDDLRVGKGANSLAIGRAELQ